MTRESKEPVVFVVDDDVGVRDSLRFLLRSVGIESELYASADEFLARFDPGRSGCLVLDVRMPGTSGIELQARLHDLGSTLPIIFITAHGEISMAVAAIKAGAVDFVQKPFRDQELLDKIHHALEEDLRLRTDLADMQVISSRVESLTQRETEVMERIVAGKANKVIASEMGISRRTVEIHRARVMAKMEAKSVSHLVQMMLLLQNR